MRISIFGLGYVGCVSAACLADRGHHVIGVDIAEEKVAMINAGKSPVVEAGLADLIAMHVASGALNATRDSAYAVRESDISLVCVGTPGKEMGEPDLRSLEAVLGEIGKALKPKDDFHVVVIRSTLLPGTTRNTVIPLLERESGKQAGEGFGVCYHPEFLREGSAIEDFRRPSRTVMGTIDSCSRDKVSTLYDGLAGSVHACTLEEAEMVKYADNVWHANKVAFANEIGRICKSQGIDSHAVMDIFCKDTKLNISPAYLRPGFAFGGSCLPKDLRALCHLAQQSGVPVPLASALLPSNEAHLQFGLEKILATGKKSVGLLGLSFKAGTDDLRESPLLLLAKRILDHGLDLLIYDPNVRSGMLTGSNREHTLRLLPDMERFLAADIMDLRSCDVIVIGHALPELKALLRPGQHVIDLVGISEVAHAGYEGICW